MMKHALAIVTAITLLGAASAAPASVVVVGSSTLNQYGGTISLSGASHSVLLVSVSAQNPTASPEVTLDPNGTPTVYAVPVVSQSEAGKDVLATIFAIDLGTASAGDLEYAVNDLGGNQTVSVFQLSNAALPAADTATATTANLSTGLDASFTGLADGSLIFAVAHAGQGAPTSGVDTVTGTPTPTFAASLDRNSFLSSSVALGYTEEVSGDASMSISGTDTSDGAAMAAIAIEPIPEPATLGLLGLGALALIRGRKA